MVRHGVTVAFGLLIVMAIEYVRGQKPHELLTDEEFHKVFRTTRNNVPEYDVVPIRHDLYKRASKELRLRYSAFGRDYDVRLNPSDGILAAENTPVWLASAGSDGDVEYKRLDPNVLGRVARLFVGPKSAIVADISNGEPSFEGTIADTTIVSWPANVGNTTADRSNRRKRDLSNEGRTLIRTGYHAIIKSTSSLNDKAAAVEKKMNAIIRRLNDTDHERRKRWAGNYVYPSILLVTDYASTPTTTYAESKFYEEIRYQLAFWNSVDLRFRDLDSPKVRLRIAGIVIGKGRSATPYINKHMNGDKFDVYSSLTDVQPYWAKVATANKDFGKGSYNVIVTITDRTMYNPKDPKEYTIGLATLGSLCRDTNNIKEDAVTIVTDDGKYDGVTTATHELGHILGAQHDISRSGTCAKKLGYLMSEIKSSTLNMNHWSPCSLNRIKSLFGSARDCPGKPAEANDPGKPIERTIAGDYVTAQEQCESFEFSWACEPTPRTCKKLQCWLGGIYGISSNWKCLDAPIGALDGTPCNNDNAVCVRGECRKGDTVVQ